MSFHLRLKDPPRCRFAVSPLRELQEAVRALHVPARQGSHLPWLRRVRTAATGLDLRPLCLLIPERGHTPGFLCPPPGGTVTAVQDELARVRAADPVRAHDELARSLADTPGAADSEQGRAMLDDPGRAVRELADLLELAWKALLAPHWPWLRSLLEADIAFHSRRLADGGPERLLRDLHPRISWADGALTIRTGTTLTRLGAPAGEELVLMPSVFVWPDVVSGFASPSVPGTGTTVVYPAHGTGGLWAEPDGGPPAALAALLGRGRATVLAALAEPATTTALARRLGLAPSSVSAHLSALRAAGLLTSDRYGHQVLYERTPLGIALVTPPPRQRGGFSPGAVDPHDGQALTAL